MPESKASAEGAPAGAPPLARRLRSRRVVVRDESMRPTLSPGDRLLVDPAAYRRGPPRRGDVIVLNDPEDRRRWLVKRIAATADEPFPGPPVPGDDGRVPPRHVFVLADNRAAGRDSRSFGPIALDRIVGRVWYRTGPADRAGPIPP